MIKLVDQLSAMGSFPIATAQDIICSDNERLQEKIDNGTLSGGGASYTELSQDEYDALTEEEKVNGTEYRTYDTGHIYKLGIEYGKDACFTSLSQLGLTADATIEDVVNALKNGESFLAPVNTFTNYETIFPNKVPSDQWNKIHIIKGVSLPNSHIRCFSQSGTVEYLANINNTNVVSWNDVSGTYIDVSDAVIEKLGNEILKYPVGKYRINSTATGNKFIDLPSDSEIKCGLIEVNGTAVGKSPFTDTWVYRMYKFECLTGSLSYIRRLNSGDTAGDIIKDSGWQKMIAEHSKTDPYSCSGYTALTGTEDLFTLPCGHYASATINTAYNYPVTDTNTTAHIYVLGCLNEPANNKGYRIILYFDNKGRMYRINEWWGSFSNGWKEIATTADHNMKTYTNVTQLGLTSPCSVVDIIKKLPKNSQLIYGSYGSETHNGGYITDAPAKHGLLEIKKSDYDGCRATMTFTESATNSMGYKRKWVAEFATGNIDTYGIKWHEVAYKAVADVGFTTINQTSGLTAPTGITMTDGSKVNYCIRNGICYVHIALQISNISAKVNNWTPIAELPKSVIEAVGAMNCEGNTVPECMPIRVSQAGKLTLMYKGTTTSTSDWWSYSFSYPVAE